MKYIFLILFFVFYGIVCNAQAGIQRDSLTGADSMRRQTVVVDTVWAADSVGQDSLQKGVIALPAGPRIDTTTYRKYETHPYLPPVTARMVYMIIDSRIPNSKDQVFYLLAGVVFFLAFIRAVFPRYFRNLFILFFQTTLRQKQTRDQLLQDSLASLLSNFLFVASASLYVATVITYKGWASITFWWLVLYCAALLLVIYLGKYLFLLFAGWVFNTKEAASSYLFLVFLVNKVIGIMLIPFLVIISFASAEFSGIALTVSVVLVALLFFYRYLVSFGSLRNNLKVNALHFFLYLCAVEVLPILLIYKVLINYIDGRF